MLATRTALVLLVGLAFASAAAPVAAASHVCHTPGDVQVCTYVPGDEHAGCLLDRDGLQCILDETLP